MSTLSQQRAGTTEHVLPISNLPTFPPVALKVLQLVSKESVRLPELSQLISADPAFASKILTIANSPLCGFRHEIASLPQAMTLLGLERVKGLAITVGLRAFLEAQLGAHAIRVCWRHSLACALLAEKIAPVYMADKDVCYAAGVMHDIGRLAMAVLWPERYSSFLIDTETNPCDVLSRERELFGIEHCEAGASLVAAWNLPPEFGEVTAKHHADSTSPANALLQVVQSSCRFADAIGFSGAHSATRMDYAALLRTFPEDERANFLPDQEAATLWLAEKINAIEIM